MSNWVTVSRRIGWGLLGALWLAVALPAAAQAPAPPASPAPAPAIPAPPPAYRVQAGDEVAVSVLPLKELGTSATVTPDGMLYLKDIGTVKAAGLMVSEIEDQVKVLLQKRLKRPRVSVSLARLVQPVPPPRVTVSGQVGKPGPVDLEPGLRVRRAVELAGGAMDKVADLARVVIVRKDLTRVTVDVSNTESTLDPVQNRVLEDGDSVFVPLLMKITVIGEVEKPGPVDLEEGLRVRKALELAGGAQKDADLTRVSVVHRDLTRQIVDLSTDEKVSDPTQNLLLQQGDSVEVLLLPQITVTGIVTKPGPVPLEPGLRVRKALDLAGGAQKEADLTRVTVIRKDLTRQVVDLSTDDSVLDPQRNVLLQPGDSVDVQLPYRVGSATIRGEGILNAGSYELKPGWGIDDLVVAAGKLTPVADMEHIQVVRGGKTVQTINLLERLKLGADGRVLLQPGDEVFVPKHPNVVHLIAPVANPGPRALREGQRISDFILDGDPQVTAGLDPSKMDLAKAVLYRKGRPEMKFSLKRVLGNPEEKQNVALQNGDLIFIPAKDMRQKTGFVDIIRSVPYLGMFANFF